jgi:hypothetical protein
MRFETETSFVEQQLDSIAHHITKWTPQRRAPVGRRWHCHQHLGCDSNDPIEPGAERGYWKPHASLSSKVRKSPFISVSKADIDGILEQVPGDGGDTHLSPSRIK